MKIKSRISSKRVRRALSLRRQCLFLRADPKSRATTKLALSTGHLMMGANKSVRNLAGLQRGWHLLL